MFNSESNTKSIPVSIKLIDGKEFMGNLIIAMTSDLPRTLNGEAKFFEFEDISGGRCFFSKNALAQVTPTDIPKVRKLETGTDSDKDFNPFRILKISPQSDAETIQAAYYQSAKLYHPDRFSGCELPDEMARYAENMSRLINAAFQVLSNQSVAATAKPGAPGEVVNL